MSHHPAELFRIDRRGFLSEGHYADMVLVNLEDPWKVDRKNILAKCGWSPFERETFRSKVIKTWVSGSLVYKAGEIVLAFAADQGVSAEIIEISMSSLNSM